MKRLVLWCCFFLLFSCRFVRHEDVGKISHLPSFQMLLMDSATYFNSDQLSDHRPVILFYFSPDCPHSRKETEMILESMDYFKEINICMLTGSSFRDLSDFVQYYHLDQYKNIMVGRDYNSTFYNVFQPTSVPDIIIYDNNKKIVKKYIGEVNIENIVAALRA